MPRLIGGLRPRAGRLQCGMCFKHRHSLLVHGAEGEFGGVAVLAVDEIVAVRGERLVFGPLSFQLEAGGAILLVGPNGAGKSTLLRIIAGLGRIEAGRVLWNGADMAADRTAHGGAVAYVGHLDAVKPGLSAAENLGARSEAGLVAMGLEKLADLPVRLFSAGQKRRLALARLMLRPAAIWLLDEPTLGLDAASVARFGVMLANHRATGGVVLAATHLPLPLPDASELRLA
jgi:heme exporter protein A